MPRVFVGFVNFSRLGFEGMDFWAGKREVKRYRTVNRMFSEAVEKAAPPTIDDFLVADLEDQFAAEKETDQDGGEFGGGGVLDENPVVAASKGKEFGGEAKNAQHTRKVLGDGSSRHVG